MGRLLPQASIVVLAAMLACGGANAVEPASPSKTVDVVPQRVRPDEPPQALDPKLPAYTPEDIAGVEGARQPVTSLETALHRTFWTNPKLIAERERMSSTDYRFPQARALFGPRLDFEASYGYERDNFEQPLGGYVPRAGWTTLVSAVLTQPVYTFGRNAAAERTAAGQVAYERAVLRYTEQQAMFNAIEAYAATLRDRAGVGIAADNLALLEKELSDTEIRFQSHETTTTDVDQVRTRVELGRAQKFAAERLAASSDAKFLSVIGAPAGELAQPNPLTLPVATLEEAYAYAEGHDPVIAAAYAREKISRAQRDAAKADLMPRVDLKGRASYGTFLPPSNGVHETQLIGQVVISGPIFESGQRRARLHEAEATNDADWRLIDSAVREQRSEVADAWNEWLSQTASIDRLKGAVDAAQRAYDGALEQERAGQRTTLDVIDLARDLLTSRSTYNSASAQAYIAQARLLAALGVLEHASLFPDARRYDPEVHYNKVNNSGDVPLMTPALRAVDQTFWSSGKHNRPLRDPAAGLGVTGVALPAPAPPPAPAGPAK